MSRAKSRCAVCGGPIAHDWARGHKWCPACCAAGWDQLQQQARSIGRTMVETMENQIAKLRRSHPQWSHLTDAQLQVADAVYKAVRKEFNLDEMDREIVQGDGEVPTPPRV